MSKESKPKRTRSTKKVSEEEAPHTAELEAKIAELEAKLANLSSQVRPAETRPAPESPKSQRGTLPAGMKPTPPPAHKAEAPKPEPAKPRPTASGPTHGTLPAGMKPTPSPAPKEQARAETSAPEVGEVAPAYAQISSSGYTGNRYYATRARLSYHPPNKQFKGQESVTNTTTTAPPPPPPAPEPQPKTQRGTLPAGMEQEKKSLWKAKGSEYENYVSEETQKAPPPAEASQPKSQRGTLPAGFKPTPPPAHKAEAPKPEPAKPRPTASGPTHGTLPAGMKPTPSPAPKEQARAETSAPEVGEVAPAYAQISSSGYTGNRYYATRRRLSYHPPNKQFTGGASSGMAEAPPTPAPAPKKVPRGTLPAGFKP